MTSEDHRVEKARARVNLLVIQTLGGLSLLPWMVGTAFTFVSIGSGGWIPLWVFAVWSYPFWLVGCSGKAWRLFAAGRYREATLVSLLPPVPVAAVIALSALVNAVAAAVRAVV